MVTDDTSVRPASAHRGETHRNTVFGRTHVPQFSVQKSLMLCLHVFIQCALPVLTIIRQVATVIQQRVQVMPHLSSIKCSVNLEFHNLEDKMMWQKSSHGAYSAGT